MKVAGKVIVVTGRGNGIGRQVVLELLTEGPYAELLDTRVGVALILPVPSGPTSRATPELMNLASRVAPRRSTHLIQRQMKRLRARRTSPTGVPGCQRHRPRPTLPP